MPPTLNLIHKRDDDVPLILGFLIRLIALWITYVLSHADHRKSHVRAWANKLHHCLEAVTGLS